LIAPGTGSPPVGPAGWSADEPALPAGWETGGPARPSEAATEFEPTPGTVGSIKDAEPFDGRAPVVPEVRLTSVVGTTVAPPAGRDELELGDACERVGKSEAGV
jgi:hypothetical protein